MYKSPHPDVEIPSVPLHEYVLADVAKHPNSVAFVDGLSKMSLTFQQIADMVDKVAAWLCEQGVRKGDVVAIFSPNTPFFVPVFHGVIRAGAVATTVNSTYGPDEVAEQLRHSGAKALFTVSLFLETATAALDHDGVDVPTLVVLDPAEGYTSLLDVLATSARPPAVDIDPDQDLALLAYTMGTTGPPKGVMLTHRAIVANLCQLRALTSMNEGSTLLGVMPFFHIYGLTTLVSLSLVLGSKVVTLPFFELEGFLRAIGEYRIGYVPIAPPMAVALAKDPLVDSCDLSCVDIVYCAAAVLDTELGETLAKRLSARVHQGYGVTEMSPATHLVPDNRSDIPPGSAGPAIPNTEFKLVDPISGKLVTSGPGELWSRGPQAMKGFWRDSARTANATDSEGFVRHGDMATVDEAGNVTILDRVADLIVGGDGYALPPAELESLLIAHPDIADVAVIGVSRGGVQVPKALVVRTGDGLTEEEIERYVAGRVPEHKRVREVEFVGSLPRNIVGKIIRRELREREERMSAQKGSNEQ